MPQLALEAARSFCRQSGSGGGASALLGSERSAQEQAEQRTFREAATRASGVVVDVLAACVHADATRFTHNSMVRTRLDAPALCGPCLARAAYSK
eukprot:scaffold4273_cov389-Prasinococcus_capsulatus_cf.AAC.1